MDKICKYCQAPFQGRRRQQFCSSKCGYLNRRKYVIKSVCDYCGISLGSSRHHASRRFCSRQCSGKSRRGRRSNLTNRCQTCNKEFSARSPGQTKSQKYCSRECYYVSYRRNEFDCQHCGKIMRGQADRRFCSAKCYHAFRREHRGPPKLPYGPDWKRHKKAALERANYRCQECGGSTNGRNVDVHHIIPFHIFGMARRKEANALDNLITLCRSCHMKAHLPS